jgi:AICAR transformylase/IMP cyclohydrolase PurH
MTELIFSTEGDQTFVNLEATVAALGEEGQLDLTLNLMHPFGYGDNPHQTGFFFDVAGVDSPLGLQKFEQVEGKNPSKSNYYDLSRGRRALTRVAANFDVNQQGTVPLVALAMKHGNAAGGAFGADPEQATRNAIMGSNEDTFGSTFMTTFPIDEGLADIMVNYEKGEDVRRRIMDVVAAPGITDEAIEMLRRVGGNMRILINPALANLSRFTILKGMEFQSDGDTVSVQSTNTFTLDPKNPDQKMQVWDEPFPPEAEIVPEILFAEGIGSSSSSNTTTIAKEGMIIGNGVGQQARHRVTELAIHRARVNGHDTTNSFFYTDSFFLKADGPQMLIDAGVAGGFGLRRDTEKPGSEAIEAFRREGVIFINVPNSVGRGFIH